VKHLPIPVGPVVRCRKRGARTERNASVGNGKTRTTDSTLDVLIVGAGPTGLALATQLLPFGGRIRIIDKLRDRTRESRALAVQARSLELLQMSGLGEELVARGNTSTRLKLHLEGRAVAAVTLGDIGAVDTRFPFILFVSQAETEAVLAEHLGASGLVVERGHELVSFDVDDDVLHCVLQRDDGSQEQVRTRFLVGCDGAHSAVRKGAGISFEGGSYPQDFVLGDVEADGPLEPNAINSFAGGGGVAMFFPLGRPTTWRVIAMAADRPDDSSQGASSTTSSDLSLPDLQAVVDSPTAAAVRLRDPAWLTRFHLHHRQTASYRRGNVFLAGDAAHIHSPVGAQGMNTGMQDAWNLGWKLALVARGVANARLLDSYEAERWPVGRFLLRFTDRLFNTFTRAMSGRPLATWARRVVAPHIVPRLFDSSWLRRSAFAFVSELGIRYRQSPAVAEGEPRQRNGPRAGDRLPDAAVEVNGRSTYLQQALAGPHLALLLCGNPPRWDSVALTRARERYGRVLSVYRLSREPHEDALIDHVGDAHLRLGVQDAAQYLVRPDGYVAFRCAGSSLAALEEYLTTWYIQAR
jgi:2-polyprenyl-6-methoxyphenol hydroxylase-like FAD-dependent oxidoreductase